MAHNKYNSVLKKKKKIEDYIAGKTQSELFKKYKTSKTVVSRWVNN